MKVVPLSNGFAATAIIGFLLSAVYVSTFSETWSFTLMLFFGIMFIASMISATKAEPTDEHMNSLKSIK